MHGGFLGCDSALFSHLVHVVMCIFPLFNQIFMIPFPLQETAGRNVGSGLDGWKRVNKKHEIMEINSSAIVNIYSASVSFTRQNQYCKSF